MKKKAVGVAVHIFSSNNLNKEQSIVIIESLLRWMEQMDNGNFVSVELGHSTLSVLDEDLGVHRQNEHFTTFAKKNFSLLWIRCVS